MISARRSIGREIRDAVLLRILEGKLKSGDRLLELGLAAEFRTSQGPVREALRELEALGYVQTVPHRGTRVRDVPATEMRDAFRLRALLEREAAEAAARTAEDWGELRAAVEGLESAAAAGDVRKYVKHDHNFHRTLVARSGNAVLMRHWDLVLVPTRILVAIRSGHIDIRKTSTEHRPILEALEQHDAALAGRLVYDHLNQIAVRLDPTSPAAR